MNTTDNDKNSENITLTGHMVGSLYEFYDKESEIISKALNINCLPKDGHMVSGFPVYMKKFYTDKLTEAGFSVKYEDPLDRAMRLINEFCEREYGEPANFSNLDHIDIAYTNDEETGLEIQVYADLESFTIIKEYDGAVVREDCYNSPDEMCEELKHLDFSELVYLSDEEKSIADTQIRDDRER